MDQAVSTATTQPTRRQLRDAVRELAQAHGALWLRPILTAAGVELISKIPTPVLRYIVATEEGRVA